MKRIAIIGGGISGLSAAFALQQSRHSGMALDYVLFEASPHFGGVLRSERVNGCLVEAGPDSFLTEKPWAIDLCRQIGLGDQLIGSNDPHRKTYILVNGRLVTIPDGLMFMVPTRIMPVVLSPLFSVATKLRMLHEWFYSPYSSPHDESVASLVERHYGAEMVQRLADPLLGGVYGGKASELSVRVVLPRFAEMEARHGSLGRAMLAARKKMAGTTKGPARPLFTSLQNGMQQLVEAVLSRLSPAALRCGAMVQAVRPQDRRWLLAGSSGSESFDAIIVATPAQAAASFLQAASPALASELTGIQYSSSVTVALGYGPRVRSALPPGFGFLVPRSESKRMLAATFVHNKFPFRAPEDRALLRCFLGGSDDPGIIHLADEDLVRAVRTELAQILGLREDPEFVRVYKWQGAMAQYGVGHLDRLDRIERLRQSLPGLALAGNAYRGIGVPDCVRSGTAAAQQVLAMLGLVQPAPEPAL